MITEEKILQVCTLKTEVMRYGFLLESVLVFAHNVTSGEADAAAGGRFDETRRGAAPSSCYPNGSEEQLYIHI